jgi:transcriptional regulator MraZ
MTVFLGEFESTLDAKGRFLLPAGLKRQFRDEDLDRFVINRGLESCLSLYPMKFWEPLYSRLSKLNSFDKKKRQFQRYFLNGATQVEPDSAGRILVPGSLKEYAGLEKDIVLCMNVDKIEIWDIGKYRKFFETFSQEEFSELAQEVLGDEDEKAAN